MEVAPRRQAATSRQLTNISVSRYNSVHAPVQTLHVYSTALVEKNKDGM